MKDAETMAQEREQGKTAGLHYCLLVFIILFSVYLITLSPTVTEEDSGDFVMASWFLGAPHPSGYPAFILAGRAAAWMIPMGSVAFRVNLLSAFLGALACALIVPLFRQLGCGRAGAFAGALLMGLSRSFWLQSVITEVYTMNLLLVLLLIHLFMKWEECNGAAIQPSQVSLSGLGPGARYFLAACLILGLGISCHQTIVLTALALIVHSVLRFRGRILKAARPRLIGTGLIMIFLGMLPYFLFVLRSPFDPFWNWGDPQGLMQLKRMFFRSQYDSVVTVKWTFDQFLGQFKVLGQAIYSQWHPAVLLFSLAGLAAGLYRRAMNWHGRGVEYLPLFLVFLGYGVLIQFLNPFPLEEIYIFSSSIFFIPAYLLLPLGAAGLTDRVCGLGRGPALAAFLLVALTGLTLYSNFELCDGSDNLVAYDFNRNIMKSTGKDPLLFLAGDAISFPINYLISIERQREDILPLSLPSLSYYWYLPQQQRRHPQVIPEDFRRNYQGQEMILPHTLKIIKANPHRRIYFTGVKEEITKEYSMYPEGIVYSLGDFSYKPDPGKFGIRQEEKFQSLRLRLPRLFLKSPELFRGQRLVAHGLLSNYTYIFYNTGTFLAEAGKYDEGFKWFSRALRFLPDHFDSLFNSGFCSRMLGRNAEALSFFRQAAEKDPKSVNALNNQAKVLLDMGLAMEAVRTLERGVRLEPWNPEPLTNIGIVLYKVGNLEKAKEFWLRALAENPRYQPAIENLKLLQTPSKNNQ